MKVFSGLQLEIGVVTLLSKIVCGRVHCVSVTVRKIPTSLLDKYKTMT